MLFIFIGFVMFFIYSLIAAVLIGNLLDLRCFLLDSLFRYLKNRFPKNNMFKLTLTDNH